MFQKSLYDTNGIYMMYFILYIPSSLFLHYPVTQKLGTRGVYIIGALLSTLCLWLRLGITSSSPFASVFFSNIFGALSFPLFVNEIPKVVKQWFPSGEVCLSWNTL
jgi:hypothetical protein